MGDGVDGGDGVRAELLRVENEVDRVDADGGGGGARAGDTGAEGHDEAVTRIGAEEPHGVVGDLLKGVAQGGLHVLAAGGEECGDVEASGGEGRAFPIAEGDELGTFDDGDGRVVPGPAGALIGGEGPGGDEPLIGRAEDAEEESGRTGVLGRDDERVGDEHRVRGAEGGDHLEAAFVLHGGADALRGDAVAEAEGAGLARRLHLPHPGFGRVGPGQRRPVGGEVVRMGRGDEHVAREHRAVHAEEPRRAVHDEVEFFGEGLVGLEIGQNFHHRLLARIRGENADRGPLDNVGDGGSVGGEKCGDEEYGLAHRGPRRADDDRHARTRESGFPVNRWARPR